MKLLLLSLMVVIVNCQEATVYYNRSNGEYDIRLNVIDRDHGVSFGFFNDTLNTTGWGVLQVFGGNNVDGNVQMYAGGYLEGYLTWERITQNAFNMRDMFLGSTTTPPSPKLVQWLDTQSEWVTKMVNMYASTDPYWREMGYIMSQFDGMRAGVTSRCKLAPASDLCHQLTLFDFRLLQDTGDFLDLMSVVDPSVRPQWLNMSQEQFELEVNKRSMCSGLIKVTYDLSELFAAHSSWFTYGAMNRIFKTYSFPIDGVATKTMTFSSYPGFLVSLDDFYQMDSGLIMVQTTNSVFNHTLYDLVHPQSLLAWQRVRVANALATSGKEWYEHIEAYNSGTYNNQYMVVDTKLFTPGKPLVANTLWVSEQIPGLVVGADITRELERGYFPSYNVPYFIEIFDKSGYPAMVKKYGVQNSYQLAPRAEIFRRDHDTVHDLESLKRIMRYNEYRTDPASKGSPWNAICSRGDLASTPSAFGCYDTKVTSYSMHQSGMKSEALNGPTTNSPADPLPPFAWTQEFNGTEHLGQPHVFNFNFVPMQPAFSLL